MLILWNGVLRLGNVHVRDVTPCYVVDLLMFRNCVLDMKISKMGCAELQGGLFENCQLWYSQVVKRSNKSSTILQHGRFGVAQESRFQASKRLNMCRALLVDGRFHDIQEFCLKQQNLQIWTVPNCMGSIC